MEDLSTRLRDCIVYDPRTWTPGNSPRELMDQAAAFIEEFDRRWPGGFGEIDCWIDHWKAELRAAMSKVEPPKR